MNFEQFPRFKGFEFKVFEQVPKWCAAFQIDAAEVERQIGMAHAWADNNPRKAPKKDMLRYLNNWLLIADRKHSLRRGTAKVAPRAPDVEGDMTIEEMREIRRRNFPQYAPDPVKFPDSVTTTLIENENKSSS